MSLEISGAWTAPPLEMRFPEPVWRAFPAKEALIRELAYVMTLAPPVIVDHPTVWYSTPVPRFFDFYNDCFELAVPNLVQHIPSERSETVLERFRTVGRHFSGPAEPLCLPGLDGWQPRRAVVPFTFGKDSLLTVATLEALGYEVFPVLIDERVLPRGTSLRRELASGFEREFGIACSEVENEIQLLSDWQVLDRPRTELNRVHIHFVYLLAMIPFCTYFRAPTVVFSNEDLYSRNTLHREGFLHPRGVMQSRLTVARMGRLLRRLSGGQLALANPIGPLGNFAIHRLLHGVFAEFGRYRLSCHLEVCDYKRWCHNCYRCAQAYLFFSAAGENPETAGFEAPMLEEEKAPLFDLFGGPHHRKDAARRFMALQEALAFSMLARNGGDAPLVRRFADSHGPISHRRENRMRRKVYRRQAKPGRHRLDRAAAKFYRRQLEALSAKDG